MVPVATDADDALVVIVDGHDIRQCHCAVVVFVHHLAVDAVEQCVDVHLNQRHDLVLGVIHVLIDAFDLSDHVINRICCVAKVVGR